MEESSTSIHEQIAVTTAQEPSTTCVLHRRQIANGFTPGIVAYFKQSEHVRRFIRRKAAASQTTAATAKSDILHFAAFIYRKYDDNKTSFDSFIKEMLEAQANPPSQGIAKRYDPYDILAEFLIYLQDEQSKINKLGVNRVRHIVSVAKKFLRMSGVKIYNEDFHELVSLPRKVTAEKAPISKIDVANILNAAEGIRLKTAIMMLAGGSGPRPIEACAVRNMDCNFLEEEDIDDKTLNSNKFVPIITYRAEFTKMRKERIRFITKELARQMRAWYVTKYRAHRTSFFDKEKNGWVWIHVEPKPRPEDLFLAYWHFDEEREISPRWLYGTISKEFAALMDKMEIGFEKGNNNNNNNKERRHAITLHSFRRFVKTTISDLGYGDFSEWAIGHAGSTYYRSKDSERLELFRKVEPYLTFLDIAALEAKGADVAAKMEERDTQIQGLIKKQEQLELLIQSLIDSGHIKPS
jgi:integrase